MKEHHKKESPFVSLLGMGGGGTGLALGAGGPTGPVTYIDDVFSAYLYEGVPSTGTTVNNGIDLSGEGGMVWVKNRTSNSSNLIYDTERGAGVSLVTNDTAGNGSDSDGPSAFLSNGFTTGSSPSADHVSWTFRKAPGFFDVVTYNGQSNGGVYDTWFTVSHSLGSCLLYTSDAADE